jgi:hypothetical protein
MKSLPVIATAVLLGMVSCETMNAPIASGDFDPLRAPGSATPSSDSAYGQPIRPGQFVRAAIDNTAFYKSRPKEGAEADKLLSRHTPMKVVSISGSYYQVELDSGEVGFVPSVMIEDPAALDTPMGVGDPFSVYPPVPDVGPVEPLPAFDATEAPPDGAIPTVIDPDAPPSTDAPPSPEPTVEPRVETVPLPPADGTDENKDEDDS